MINVDPKYVPSDFTILVSGGIDSIAAAHWLITRFRRIPHIIHFNHNIQENSGEMETKVEKFIRDYGNICDSTRWVYRRRTVDFPDESENGLRGWRISEMAGIGGNFVTGHHLNDAVENYLLNTIKGCPEHLPLPWQSNFPEFKIFHPFLRCTKKDFEEYITENNLEEYVVEDISNCDNKYKRNFLRNEIIPLIDEYHNGEALATVVKKKFYS